MPDVTHQLAAQLGSGWLIEPAIAGLDDLVLPRPHLLMHASSRVLDAIEQAHRTVAGLWPTLPPGFAARHSLPREADNFADAYDMLQHLAFVPGRVKSDPLRAWTERAARAWLRDHAVDNAEADHACVFVDASLDSVHVATLIPEAWHRRSPTHRLTLSDQVPALAAAIDPLGWVMLHLDSHGESPRLLLYVAGGRLWNTHEPIRQALIAGGIPHAYVEHVGGAWRVRSSLR
ncbi:MAG: hypothetical protein ACOYPS_07235 [Phycisphaerales bacterium]